MIDVQKGDIIKFRVDDDIVVCGRVQYVVNKSVYVDIGKAGFINPRNSIAIKGWVQLGTKGCAPFFLDKTENGYECRVVAAIANCELTALDTPEGNVKC